MWEGCELLEAVRSSRMSQNVPTALGISNTTRGTSVIRVALTSEIKGMRSDHWNASQFGELRSNLWDKTNRACFKERFRGLWRSFRALCRRQYWRRSVDAYFGELGSFWARILYAPRISQDLAKNRAQNSPRAILDSVSG